MYDDDFTRRTWPERLLKWCVWGGLVAAAAWLFFHRQEFWPRPITPRQRLATLRNHTQREGARRIATDHLQYADATVVPGLIEELKSGDALGRELAALALGRLGPKADDAAEALIAAGKNPVVSVRRQATIALGRIGAPPAVTIAGLRDRLRDAEALVRDAAFSALRQQRWEGARELANLLHDSDPDVRRRAAIELGQMGYDAIAVLDELRTALADSDPRVRAETYAALARHDAIEPDALIAGMTDDPDPLVRRTAATLFARDPDVSAETLVAATNDADSLVRTTALTALGKRGEGANEAVPAIAALLDSSDERTATCAANALGQIGPVARSASAALRAHAEDPRESVRWSARSALERLAPFAGLRPPELFAALDAYAEQAQSLVLRGPTPGAGPYGGGEQSSGITDADMIHFKRLHRLERLDLSQNPVGDAGLAHLAELKQLEELHLDGTKVGSAGLAHIAGLTNLRSLSLFNCPVDDEGLKHLKNLRHLTQLALANTRVTDAGMRHLAHLTQLRSLWLPGPKITDAGMPHLANLTELRWLGLSGTKVTDAGLAHLKRLTSLEGISFPDQVTLPGLAQLSGLTTLNRLPKSVTDADLDSLTALTRLRELDLSRTSITDAGLVSIGKLTSLESLFLGETRVTDAGLTHLKPLSDLRLLIAPAKVSQRGADELKSSLPELKIWPFDRPPIPATGYEVVGLKTLDWPRE